MEEDIKLADVTPADENVNTLKAIDWEWLEWLQMLREFGPSAIAVLKAIKEGAIEFTDPSIDTIREKLNVFFSTGRRVFDLLANATSDNPLKMDGASGVLMMEAKQDAFKDACNSLQTECVNRGIPRF